MPIRRAREWTARGALVGLIAGTIYVGAFAVIFGLRSALDGWNTLWVGMVLLAVIAVPVGSALGTIVGLIVRTSETGGGEIATPRQERRTALFVIAVAFMVVMGLFSGATRTAQLVFVVGPAVIGAIVSLLIPIPRRSGPHSVTRSDGPHEPTS
jgi:MFS family permease